MKAAITDGKGNLWLEEIPVPMPNETQCLCKMQVCATCTGTDKKHIHNQLPWEQEYPGILGHESVGIVLEVGKKVRAFKPGDMVIRPTAVYNGEHFAGFSSLWGGFAEYGFVTDSAAFHESNPGVKPNPYVQFQLKVPADLGISPEEASMMITLKEVIGYAESVGVAMNHATLLLGTGGVGLAFCEACKLLGATPLIVAARSRRDFDRALSLGADYAVCTSDAPLRDTVMDITHGMGVEHIIDCTGAAEFVQAAIGCISKTGKVSPYAKYPKNTRLSDVIPQEIILEGRTGEVRTHQWACSAYRHGLLRLNELYSHKMPFSDIINGFGMIERKEAFKIVFEMN
ncbi:MAG: zinc-binding dehydrogenase [Victivallales bacterium]|nr:zinc-binding dehydrogenase [Victivallales bacterium]